MSRLLINRLPLWKGQSHRGTRFAPVMIETIIRKTNRQNCVISGGIEDQKINNTDNIQDSIYYDSFKLLKYYKDGDLLINLGGDHAIAMGTVPLSVFKYPNIKVVWVDAHTDIHSPDTSLSGNCHGMPVWYASELSGPPLYNKLKLDNLYYYGIRDVEEAEQIIIQENSIKYFTSEQINEKDRSDEIIEWLGDDPVHLSIDVDGLDPEVFPSTGVTASEGMSLDSVTTLVGKIKQTGNLKAVDLVEFNPELGSVSELDRSIKCLERIVETLV